VKRKPLRAQIGWLAAVLLGSCWAFAGTFTAFGPQTYVRGKGNPVAVSSSFSILNPNTQYTLRVEAPRMDEDHDQDSDDGDPRARARIFLNGKEVVNLKDFTERDDDKNRHDPVLIIQKNVQLLQSDTISVEVRGKRGTSVTVSITGVDNDPPLISASANPAADVFGWNNANVVVTFTCSDKTSGVASCPAPVTVSTEGANQVIRGTAADKAGNAASTSVTINLDKKAPTISASPAPPANAFGWNNAAVTVNFNCLDILSGIATCTAPATLNAEGAKQIAAGTAVDRAGNMASASASISIDRTPPTIVTTATPAANPAGWNNTTVDVVFTCADTLSGVASCPTATAVRTEGSGQNISGTATDKAGNRSTTAVLLNIDKTPPLITANLVPAANSFAWNNSSVTVNFVCSDTLSGVAQCAAPVPLTQEGAGQTAKGSATDVAGNAASSSATVNIDETPPTITASAAPAPNLNGWNNTDVTISFTCSDLGSGIASCPPLQTVGAEGANQTISGTATDKAGNTASAKAILNIDKTPPAVTANVSPAANAAGWNNSNVTVNFNCTDALSGVDLCPAQVIASTEGANQAFLGTARDRAGNTADASATLNIDKTPPNVKIITPLNGALVIVPTVTIGATVTDTLSGIAGVTCNGIPAQVSGASVTCGVPLTAGSNAISIVATDVAGNSTTSALTVNFSATPTITIISPINLSVVNTTSVTVTGTVNDPAAQVNVNGIAAPLVSGGFSVPVSLKEGGNTITAVAQSAGGTPGTATITISLDTTPPHVTIDSPPDGTVTTASSIAVSGMINDIVAGTVNIQQASVTVNGISAQVLNRNYLLRAVPLSPGLNTLTAIGTDLAGNSSSVRITVVQKAAVGQPFISLVSGDSQTATIGTPLPTPLGVQLKDAVGKPVAGQPVVFKVTGSNGTLSGNPIAGANGGPTLVVSSDANGQAQVTWTLGMRAGAGNNTVKATAANFAGEVNFGAISLPASPGLISVDSGGNQTGAVGQPLPHPFVVVVTDPGHNRLPNIPVTFTVQQGGGFFTGQGSQVPLPGQTNFTSIIVKTDSDGRAMAILTLGQQEGIHNNLVEASFAGNQEFPAAFTTSGRVAGDPAATSISGVALDNTNIPIAGVTLQVDGTGLTTQSDQQGQFLLTGVPVGRVKLIADGATAARPGTWPKLEYELVTVSGQNNTLGMPVYLLPLDTPHGLPVDETHGGMLTLADVPGFSLTIAPGSVTFPDGGKSGLVSVTLVHADKVPMTPNFGQQPRFIVSIQPAGAHFNPPAPMTLPNVDGLTPGEVTEMYSFDHDLGSFVAIGTGTVSKDGSVIKSDPGVGIVKGGWHCGGNPQLVGTTADCAECQICQINGCAPDPGQNGKQCGSSSVGANSCKDPGVCAGGVCGGVTNKPDGSTCDDGLFCTTDDTCTSGACKGTPIEPGHEVKTSYSLNQLSKFIERVSEFIAILGLGDEISLPEFGGSLEFSSQDKCCEELKSMGAKKGVQGTLETTFVTAKPFRPQFPPWTASIGHRIFGTDVRIAYGVEFTGSLGASVSVATEVECGGPVCWKIGGKGSAKLNANLFGELTNPLIPPKCGPSKTKTCTLAKITAGFSTSFDLNFTPECKSIKFNPVQWGGITVGYTLQLLEGTFLDYSFSKQLVLVEPKTIGDPIEVPLPSSL